MTRFGSPTVLVVIGLGIGLSVDILFYRKPPGVSFPLFMLLCVAVLFGTAALGRVRPAWRNAWLLVPLLFFSGMVFVRAAPFLTFLNGMASLALLWLAVHFFAVGRVTSLGFIGYPLVFAAAGLNALIRPAPLVATVAADFIAARKRRGRYLASVLRGLILAAPILCVFTVLLASADIIFARYVENVLYIRADFMELSVRAVLVLIVGWIATGALAHALYPAKTVPDSLAPLLGLDSGPTPGLPLPFGLGFIESAIVLIAVDLLFLVFVGIQFVYLFGGRANISVEGFTYAEYARRGFFELCAVSAMTLLLVFGLERLTRRETSIQFRAFNILGVGMVALTVVMLVSALQRLSLYEETFGYTHLRVYVHVFMVWLGIAFAIFLWTFLASRPHRFPFGAFLAALGFLATLNMLNPDGFIAEQNLRRYWSTGRLDVAYLLNLSEDAMPQVLTLLETPDESVRQMAGSALDYRLQILDLRAAQTGWPSTHLSLERAHALLAERRETLAGFRRTPSPTRRY